MLLKRPPGGRLPIPPTKMPSLVEVEAAAAAVRAVLGGIAAALPQGAALPRVTVLLATAVAVPAREVVHKAVEEAEVVAEQVVVVVVVRELVHTLEASAAWATSTLIPTSYPKGTSYPNHSKEFFAPSGCVSV